MELVWNALVEPAAPQGGDSAFLVGMLSLVDVLLEQPLEEALGVFNLHQDVSNALLEHEGTLGTLLALVKAVERLDMDQVRAGASELGIEVAELQALDHSAYGWVHDLARDQP